MEKTPLKSVLSFALLDPSPTKLQPISTVSINAPLLQTASIGMAIQPLERESVSPNARLFP
jgi:hypothetical protein